MPNVVQYYKEFQECFDDLLKHIDSARSRVWVETYCLDHSSPAKELIATLTKAALRGTQCILCVDALGSIGCLPKSDLALFREAGGKLCIWNPIRLLFHRNHRKLAVCDNTLYCMSGNFDKRSCVLSSESKVSLQKQKPLDINNALSIRGPVAMEGIKSVCRTIRRCRLPFTRKALPSEAGWVPESSTSNLHQGTRYEDVLAKWLESEGGPSSWLRPINTYKEELTFALDRAVKHIFVASAYFQPPRFLRRKLLSAADRGVDVEILVSGHSDIIGDSPATEFTVRKHLFSKPLVWRTLTRHLHTKTLIVDKTLTVFGSYNWDRFSARRNREAGLLIRNKRLAQQVFTDLTQIPKEQIVNDDGSTILHRAKQWICYHALRITART